MMITSVPFPQRFDLGVEAAQHEPVLLLQEPDAVLQVRDPGCRVPADYEATARRLRRRLLHLKVKK